MNLKGNIAINLDNGFADRRDKIDAHLNDIKEEIFLIRDKVKKVGCY